MVTRFIVALSIFTIGLSVTVASAQSPESPPITVPTNPLVASKTPTTQDPVPVDPKLESPKVQDPKLQDPKPKAEDPKPKVQDPKPIVQDPKPVVQDPKSKVQDPKPNVTESDPSDKKDESKPAVKPEPAKIRSEHLLPASTKAWVSIPDPDLLESQFDSTQFGLLAKDPAIKPFIESFRDQAKEWINGQNVRLGLEIDDLHGVHSGEICLAGVFPELDGKQPAKGSHGLILLVDVSQTEMQARVLQEKINAELLKQGAKQEDLAINGVHVTKSTINNPNRIRQNQSNFQAIVNGWMLVADNENIFRSVLKRLSAPKTIKPAETLAARPAFVQVMDRTDLGKHTSHVRWFVDPFGYMQLAEALQNESRRNRVHKSELPAILKDNGFDVFQGIGGNVSVATGEHEILHRTFTYAPKNAIVKNAKRVFDLFDFANRSEEMTPPDWVPANCSAYVTGNWEMTKALGSVGHLYDSFVEEGEFARMLSDLKVDPDFQLDVKKLVGLVDNRFTIVSAAERPITENSERVIIGFPIKGEPQFIFDSLTRVTRGEVISLGGIKVLKAESLDNEELPYDDQFTLPDDDLHVQEIEPDKPQFQLFETRYFVMHRGYLLVSNDKNFLRKLLAQKKSTLDKTPDYLAIKEALNQLTVVDNISWRQFGRTDLALETNYEMLRRGEMGESQTVLARVINQIFAQQAAEKAAEEGKDADPDEIRKQKLDGSKLPEDYTKNVAPYFGPTGWVLETEDDGWRITGCVLKKKGMTEVAQKIEDE